MTISEFEVVTLVVGQMATNCYLIMDRAQGEALIVDPGDAPEYITDKMSEFGCKPSMILATHGHFDHIMGAFALQHAYGIPFYIHKDDVFLVGRMSESAQHFLEIKTIDPPPAVNQTLEDNAVLRIGRTTLTVMHTPGHTPGSICLYAGSKRLVIAGDTMFANGGVGRTDFSYSDRNRLAQSVRLLLALPVDIQILPGHGDATTVGKERRYHIQS